MLKSVLPRYIRLRDASHYLGMDKNRFDVEVRPFLTQIPIGIQGIAFDRLDLDAWADEYKSRNGRPPKEKLWDAKEHQGSGIAAGSGTSRNRSLATRLQAALEQAASMKRS